MARLSSSIEHMKSHYTVVVIGSGYGGGIAASRLARAGQTELAIFLIRHLKVWPNSKRMALMGTPAPAPAYMICA
jgi:succinate dehydrogenase/fumarate reductase flavoprotein subunit